MQMLATSMTKESISNRVSALIDDRKYQVARDMLLGAEGKSLRDSITWLNMLGVCERGLGHPDLAVQAYAASLRANDGQAKVWSNLGNAYKDLNRLSAAVKCQQIADDLSGGNDPLILHNKGISVSMTGDHETAIALFEKALALNPARKEIWWDLARSQLALLDYGRGWDNYKKRWNFRGAGRRRFNGNEWDGTDLTGKTILVLAEQGFGDYIQCVRFVRQLATGSACKVVLEVKPELKALIAHSFARFGNIELLDYQVTPAPVKHDCYVFIVDLPGHFARDYVALEDVPYLHADPSKAIDIGAPWDPRKLNVGIVWCGSQTFARNSFRSTDVQLFLRHFNVPGVQLHSLQMGERKADIAKLKNVINPLDPLIHDFSDTVQVLGRLDLVISTCTSMVHLCGAIGKECWVLLDYSPHWLWGTSGERTRWYSSLRLFRQQVPGGWEDLFDRVSGNLMPRAAANSGKSAREAAVPSL